MLGIVGAHSLLLRSRVQLSLFDEVLHTLRQLVPDHPDLAALGWMRTEVLGSQGEATIPSDRSGPPVTWPPMLMRSYAALVRRDAANPGAIAVGSPAERVSAQLVTQSVWTTWRPREVAGDAGLLEATPTAAFQTWAASLRALRFRDAGTQRVASYLSEFAQRDKSNSLLDLLASFEPGHLTLATGLPTSLVQRSVAEISRTLRDVLDIARMTTGSLQVRPVQRPAPISLVGNFILHVIRGLLSLIPRAVHALKSAARGKDRL
jgi:hypothetical protein